MQTPQAFRADVAAERRSPATSRARRTARRSSSARGGRVRVVEGDRRLLKVTTPDDLASRRASAPGLTGGASRAVFFDVGETLVDERRYWREVAELAGVPEHALWAALGVTIARGEDHTALFGHLGVEQPAAIDDVVVYRRDDLYPDAARLPRRPSVRRGIGSVLPATSPRRSRPGRASEELPGRRDRLVGLAGACASRQPAFFERLVAEAGFAAGEVAYVGDRVDNDVVPAAAPGCSPSGSAAAPGVCCRAIRSRPRWTWIRSPGFRQPWPRIPVRRLYYDRVMRWRRDGKCRGDISGTPLFAGCSREELRTVAAACREERVPEGHVLIREGDERGREFYVLLDGTVEVRRERAEDVGVLGPGEWVGEVALISHVPRTATVVTTSAVELLLLTDHAFQQLLNDVPSIAAEVDASLTERQRPMDHVVVVTFQAAGGRQWSAIGGGATADEAVEFARECCLPDEQWELVGSSSLHGD